MKGSTRTIFFQRKMLLVKRSWHKSKQNQHTTEKEVWHRENIKKCMRPSKKLRKQKEEQIKIGAEKRAEKERLRQERYEEFLRSKESKKVDEGIIDVKVEMTAENLTKMADQVMMAKALEVDSTSASESESSEKVSSSGSDSEPCKAENAKSESDRRNCMKECKVCNIHEYLSRSQIQELTNKINILNREVIGRDKLVKSSTDRINELTEKIKTDENDVEHFRKENENLMLENIKISEDFDKLKSTIKDSDERNIETRQENSELSSVLQAKEKLINVQLDEIANLKLQYQEAKIENERINLKLNSYTSASFVLQHIVPKPIGQNKEGEDVPPPMRNNFTKKQSGLVNESDSSEKSDAEKLPDNIDVTFNSQSDEDSI
ncbi:golgin subfamily A member 6-like protein 1 [Helianthus annuus]|uniref:golgin subfamily A member 6-like protein 1 n=1 Tax=Helianthus annuus TaxID=4232 RepID=UPI000B8F719D|nr:golgin subfamily A member 6-like protein 1 [Helianthus annuus]